MIYKIDQVNIISENGAPIHQVLSLQATYNATETIMIDGEEQVVNLTSIHNKIIPLEADPKEEATIFAAELESILTEPKQVTREEVEVSKKAIKESDVIAKVAEIESLKTELLEM